MKGSSNYPFTYTLLELDTFHFLGADRQLTMVDLKALRTHVSQATHTAQSVTVTPMLVRDVTACTTFALHIFSDGVYVCVATAEKILIMKYNTSMGSFVIKRVGFS